MSLAELDPVLVRPLRRPEPRRKPSRKPARSAPQPLVRPVVWRNAAMVLGVGVGVAFAGRIGSIASEPILATHRTGQQIRSLKRVLTTEGAKNAQLQRDIAYLSTPAGIEQEARRRGWVRPGEVALSLVGPEAERGRARSQRVETPTESRAAVSIAGRIREAVDTCLAVLGGKPRSQ